MAAAGQRNEQLQNKCVTIELSSSRRDGQLAITCKYDPALLAHIKALPSRTWHRETKKWLCPGDQASPVMSHFRDAGVRVLVQEAAPQPLGGTEVDVGMEQASRNEIVIQLAEDRRDGNIAVTFPFSPERVEHMKLLPAELRRWDKQEKAWLCPAHALEEIKTHWRQQGIKIKIMGAELKEKERLVPMLSQEAVEQRLSELPQEPWDKLFPYQREGIEFGVKRNAKVILADEMGLGKTVQAIMIAAAFREDWPLLIICPSTLRLDWESALHTWLPSPMLRHVVTIMSGSDIQKKLAGPLRQGQITIASFDMAQKIGEKVCKGHSFVICDESHSLKNHAANRTIFLRPILRAAAHTVLISGTPIQTRPIDMYTQIDAVRPGLLGSRDDYGRKYCGGSKVPTGNGASDWRGASNVEELNGILQATILVRRLKKDVLKDLPDKMRREVAIEISAKDQKALKELRNQLTGVEQDSGLNESQRRQAAQQLVNELYRATGRVKLPGSVEHLKRLLQAGHKVLAFAHHSVIMDGLEEAVNAEGIGYVRIDGHCSPLQKKAACDRFQTCLKVKAAILSITAAGTGITLTEASAVMFAELTWNPSDLVQAEDRAHRVGQKNFLQVHYMVAAEPASADDMMWRNLRNKLNVVGRVIDGRAQGGAAGLEMNKDSLAASRQPAMFATPSIPATPQAARPPLAMAPDHTPLNPGGAAAGELPGKSRLTPSANRMQPVLLDECLAEGTGVFAATQEALGVGFSQPIALDDSQDGGTGVFAAEPGLDVFGTQDSGTGVFAAEPGPDMFGTQQSQAAWQASPEDTPPPSRRLPPWMDDYPGHRAGISQIPRKRKAFSPAEDPQTAQCKLLRSLDTANGNTQGSRDDVIDLTQPTQMYQPTLAMAGCQPDQSSLQQPVATGVFADVDDGDEIICID